MINENRNTSIGVGGGIGEQSKSMMPFLINRELIKTDAQANAEWLSWHCMSS